MSTEGTLSAQQDKTQNRDVMKPFKRSGTRSTVRTIPNNRFLFRESKNTDIEKAPPNQTQERTPEQSEKMGL